jgi:alpha-glucosidase
MNRTSKPLAAALLALAFAGTPSAPAAPAPKYPPVSSPPESFFEMVSGNDREAARKFYQKYIDVEGMPVVASPEVADLALQRTYDIVTHLLAGRPDVLHSMVTNKMYLIIIGKDQKYTDMPEYRNSRNPDYLNERVRGTGGRPTSFGEENLLSLPLDRYDDESIGVHEFCHTIDFAMSTVDPTWRERKNKVYRDAVAKGLWKNTYAGSNPGEFWSEICQSYFDNNRINNWNHGPIGNREQLKAYDPESYDLVKTAFNLSPEQDWHYTWLQKLPNVTPPPAKFNVDPYYTKFTWAREFTVVGRQASDEALLKANDTIRKMFAYRHDILKAIIGDGVKMVVLGRKEKLTDLPELKKVSVDKTARSYDYTSGVKLLVAPEENVLGPTSGKAGESCQVIREFAKAMYAITATRAVDTNWNNRGRSVQQYEMRVKRIDIQFDERLKKNYEAAMSKELWKNSRASQDRVEYWAEGVLAYFDATGGRDSSDSTSPPHTREALKEYDPELYALVHETMAYEDHSDWRYTAYHP